MKIAYYLNSNDDGSNISSIKKYYNDKYAHASFFITYKGITKHNKFKDTASINFFYVNFMRGKIIFSSVEDYQQNSNILADAVLVVRDKSKVPEDKNMFEEILFYNGEKLENIK